MWETIVAHISFSVAPLYSLRLNELLNVLPFLSLSVCYHNTEVKFIFTDLSHFILFFQLYSDEYLFFLLQCYFVLLGPRDDFPYLC